MDTETPKSILSAKPTRKPRGFKIALIILAALVVLFVCTIYFLPSLLPMGTIKNIAKSQAKDLAGLDLDFETLSFGWNGDVVIENIAVAPLSPDGEPGDQLLHIKTVRTNVALTPLLSGRAVINSVDVDGASVTLRRAEDGSLNIPDFENLPANTTSSRRPAATLFPVALAADGTAALPPVELHRLDIRNSTLAFSDAVENIDVAMGLDFMRVDGKTLDDPFLFNGRLLPYVGEPEKGDLPFTGSAALLHGGAFNPAGEASIEVDVKTLHLEELAAKFGLGETIPAARLDGLLRAAYAERKAMAEIPEMRLSNAVIGLGGDAMIAVPDTVSSLHAEFDPESGRLLISDLSVTNDLAAIRARGQADGVNNLAHGVLPAVGLDFSGAVDFSYAAEFLASQPVALPELPELAGNVSFVGKAALPANHTGDAPAPSLSIDCNDGQLRLVEAATGISAEISLNGIGVRAAASLGDDVELNSQLTLANLPGRATLPQLDDVTVAFTVNGGAALEYSPDGTGVEFRLANTSANVPATAWSAPMDVTGVETRITYDLQQDLLHIASAQAVVNQSIEGKVVSGSIGGIASGSPQGQVDLQLTALLDKLREIAAPLIPADLLQQLAGSLRGVTRVQLANNGVEAFVQGELDNAAATLHIVPGESQAEVQSPKATLAMLASLDLANPTSIAINSLEANGSATALRFSDTAGNAAAGQLGPALVKLSGNIDAAASHGALSALSVDVNGLALALGKDGQQLASLASGLMKVVAATAEQPLQLPLSGKGDFAVPNLDFGIDNLVFQFKEEPSHFGNVRAKLAVDGYIGDEKRQLVNLRTASLAATPIAINSRGQLDLGAKAVLAQYAARVAPSGLASLFTYLGLPPALLTDAAASGTVTYSNAMIEAKGSAEGKLSAGQNQSYPFQAVHDFSAAWNTDNNTLALDVRRLEGGVKTPAGEAVATLQAQQSKLLLSAAGSKGLLDIRVNGSAAPTRYLLLGLAGMLPQLQEFSNALHTSQADGVYNAWLQISDKDEAALALNMGGVWQGAALSLNGAPYLAEAARLSAAMEGEWAYRDNRVSVSRLLLRSDSGMMQADGVAAATYVADQNHLPVGLGSLNLNLRFVMADLAKAALVFPGVVPQGMALAGRVDGSLKAAGNADAIRIGEGAVRFQNFKAGNPQGLDIAIPEGGASFGADIALHPDAPAAGSPFQALHMIDIANGTGAISGIHISGQAIQDMSAAFQLQGGVFTLQHARLNAAEGLGIQGEMAASADFNSTNPAAPIASVNVNARFSVADLARTASLLPGLIPDMGLAGRVDGVLQAGGAGNAVRINEGSVQFQGFRAVPSEGMEVTIANGAAAFGGTFDLHCNGKATGSEWDALRMFNLHDGQARLTGATVRSKAINDLSSAFQLENGVLAIRQTTIAIGGGAEGSVAMNGSVDFNGPQPVVNTRMALRNIPLAEANSEIKDFMQFESGVLHIPATEGQAAAVAFTGFSEDDILRTLRLENFTFATSPVKLHTGPALNAELDKARAIMKQQMSGDKVREITFSSIQGSAVADGSGVITIPESAPINLVGDNTADFRAHGVVKADHTMNVRVMVAGKLENLIGFSLPNLIPSIRTSSDEDKNRFMNTLNQNAAKGHYGVNIVGNLDNPDISGISAVAAIFVKDLLVSVPGQVLGGVLDLGKDAPGALVDVGGAVVDGLLNPGQTIKNAPENIIKAPENIVKGLGKAFGITRNKDEQ